MRGGVDLRTAYGAELTIRPEPGPDHVRSHRGSFGDSRKWQLVVGDALGVVCATSLSRADLLRLRDQINDMTKGER